MNYLYDTLGRFAGVSDTPTDRSTTVAPAEQTVDYNWNGVVWVYAPNVRVQPVGSALPPPPFVPQEITMRQARLVLLGAGLLSGVQTAIDGLPEPQRSAANIEWEFSNTLQRRNPFALTLGPALGLTAEQIDALFTQGAAL